MHICAEVYPKNRRKDMLSSNNKTGYRMTVMTWLAIIGTVMLLITFFTTKERIVPKPEQKSSVKEDLGDLIKNVPWVIMLVLTTLVFVTLAMKGGSYVFYFENYVDQDQLKIFLALLKRFCQDLKMIPH